MRIVKPATSHATDRHDALTVAAVAVIVYALSSLLREGVGHGGACFAVHGVASEQSSIQFDCTLRDGASTAARIVAAGGTVAPLLGGGLALLLYLRRPDGNVWRYLLWLFAAVNLMQGTGDFLLSGVGSLGDLAGIADGWQGAWLWRLGFAASGSALYVLTTIWLFRALDPFVGEARPRRYQLTAVLMSGAVVSLFGASGLAWGPQTLRGRRTASSLLEVPVPLVERSWLTIALAMVSAAVFVIVFGRGLTLSSS